MSTKEYQRRVSTGMKGHTPAWWLPESVVKAVIERDHVCIYCGCSFIEGDSRKQSTWEYIRNNPELKGEENIGLACNSCNASKNNRPLEVFLQRNGVGVSGATIATVVFESLRSGVRK